MPTSTTTDNTTPRFAYAPEEAARLCGLSRAYIYKLMTAGVLPSVRIGRTRRIRHDDIMRLLAEGCP